MIAVYFTGASGTGKTTLAEFVSKAYGFEKLPSVSRSLITEMSLTADDYPALIADKERYHNFQVKLAWRQAEMEAYKRVHNQDFVSDRAFDHMVFMALYGTRAYDVAQDSRMVTYLDYLKGSPLVKTFVFLVKPQRNIRQAAIKQGGRQNFLNWEDMNSFHGACKFILETNDIPYELIDTPGKRAREAQIRKALFARDVREKEKQ